MRHLRGPLGGRPGEVCDACRWPTCEHVGRGAKTPATSRWSPIMSPPAAWSSSPIRRSRPASSGRRAPTGQLLGCTYLKEQKVQGWHRHPMTNGAVEALAVIPGSGADELWLIVRRTINGATRRYVEQMQPPFGDDAALEDAWFVDCGLAWDGAPATVFSGLDHLEGQSVDILADGAPHPSQVVAGGQITLASAASRVIVGLGYASRLETMPLEFGQPEGTAQSRKRKVDRVMVRLLRSLGCALGVGSGPVDEVPFRLFGDPLDVPPPLFTGDKLVQPTGGWEDSTVWVQQTQPLPLTVLAIAPRVTAYD